MLASYTLEPLIACVWGRGKSRHYSQLEWCLNETLQLQRLAHELRGRALEARTAEFVPAATLSSEELPPLYLTDAGRTEPMGEKDLVPGRTFDSGWSYSPPASADEKDKEKM